MNLTPSIGISDARSADVTAPRITVQLAVKRGGNAGGKNCIELKWGIVVTVVITKLLMLNNINRTCWWKISQSIHIQLKDEKLETTII